MNRFLALSFVALSAVVAPLSFAAFGPVDAVPSVPETAIGDVRLAPVTISNVVAIDEVLIKASVPMTRRVKKACAEKRSAPRDLVQGYGQVVTITCD